MNALHSVWLQESLGQIPEDLTADNYGLTHRQIVESYLLHHIRRCRAQTRPRFWSWLRLTLAKDEAMSLYLMWVRESKLQPEIVKPQRDGFQYSLSNDGGTALILVIDGSDHAVWKIPTHSLDWALSLYPVRLKRLPEVESQERAKIRQLKRQIKTKMPFLKPEMRAGLESGIAELEAADQRAYAPVPRFTLTKYQDGKERQVHRLYVGSADDDEIVAVDDDFLNFGTVTAHVTITTNCGEVRKNPEYESELVVQNLQIMNNAEAQKDFEKHFLQTKLTPYGDINVESLRVQPNFDLGKRTGIEGGEIQDCGPFKPLSETEKIWAGFQGTEARARDSVDAISRKWRVPTSQGARWG